MYIECYSLCGPKSYIVSNYLSPSPMDQDTRYNLHALFVGGLIRLVQRQQIDVHGCPLNYLGSMIQSDGFNRN